MALHLVEIVLQDHRGRGRIEADVTSRGNTVGTLRAALNGTARLSLQPAALRGVDLAQTLRTWRSATTDQLASDVARQTEFSQLEGSFELRNGVAHNSDLAGSSEFLRVSGEGRIDLAQGRLDYLLRTRVANTASGRAGPEMMMLNGVTVPVHGPSGEMGDYITGIARPQDDASLVVILLDVKALHGEWATGGAEA